MNFDDLIIRSANNGVVVQKAADFNNSMTSIETWVFNSLDHFYDWFDSYVNGESNETN